MPDELVTTPGADLRELAGADDVVRAPTASLGLTAHGGSLRRLVIASDALALVLAILLSGLVPPSVHGRSGSLVVGLVLFAATLPAWLVGARLTGLYRLEARRSNGGGVEEWLSIGRLIVIGTWVVSTKKHPATSGQSAELASLTVKVLRQDGESFSGTIIGLKGKSERIVGAFRRDGVTFIYSSEKTAGIGQVQGSEMQICRTDAGCAVLIRSK